MKKKRNRLIKNAGFSLLEVLVALFVLTIGVAGSLRFFVGAAASARYSGDLTEAYTHLEYILEEMKTREGLSQINATDWDAWADSAALKTLPQETFSVSYPQGTDADPLEIELTISWLRGDYTQNASISTQITE